MSTDRYRFVYFRALMEYWCSRWIGSLRKSFPSDVINVFAPMHLVNDLINPFLRVFYYR